MANSNPSPLTRFKPGQSGNPAGTHPWPAEMKSIRKLTKLELAEVGSMLLKHDMAALQAVEDNPASTVLQRMVAAVAQRVVRTGDMELLDRLLNRLVGPVRQEVDHRVTLGVELVERVAGVLERNLQHDPDLLLKVADELAALMSGDPDDRPIDVTPAEGADAAGA